MPALPGRCSSATRSDDTAFSELIDGGNRLGGHPCTLFRIIFMAHFLVVQLLLLIECLSTRRDHGTERRSSASQPDCAWAPEL